MSGDPLGVMSIFVKTYICLKVEFSFLVCFISMLHFCCIISRSLCTPCAIRVYSASFGIPDFWNCSGIAPLVWIIGASDEDVKVDEFGKC